MWTRSAQLCWFYGPNYGPQSPGRADHRRALWSPSPRPPFGHSCCVCDITRPPSPGRFNGGVSEEHGLPEVPPPPSLGPAYCALQDAHDQWHDAFDTYHDPRPFRRHVDALIQSLRNVTFRLQAAKSESPLDFDAWYGRWREHMRSDPNMKWLHDARTEVVKRSGIQSSSYALVRIIDSYNEPAATVLRLPPTVSTEKLLDKARTQVPDEFQRYVALEVRRRWTAPDADGKELLGLLACCFHVLDALLIDAVEMFGAGRYSDPPHPADFLTTVQLPPCMAINASLIPVVQEADTGDYLQYSPRVLERDDLRMPEAIKRYGLPKNLPEGLPNDLVERAHRLHDIARTMFKRDGVHHPFAHFRRYDGVWDLSSPITFDKRDKYLMWHRYGIEALRQGHDAVIFTTEVWAAPAPDVMRPYEKAEDSPQRKELLMTFAEEESGGALILDSEIVRVLGKPFLKRTKENSSPKAEEMAFFGPLRRAWSVRSAELEVRRSDP